MNNNKYQLTPVSKELSGFLDSVRWLSALCVVIEHLRYVWFTDYTNVQSKTLLIKLFYFFSGFGSEALILFFVLSGYLVGGGAIRKWHAGTYSAKDYFISRFSRIYTVLLPALVIGGLLDWVGLYYFNITGIYTISPNFYNKFLDYVIANNLNWTIFFANLVNLQELSSPHLGSNGPLWSLAYEWWLYCIFGMVLEIFRRSIKDPTLWIVLVLIVIVLIYSPLKFIVFMGLWAVGVLAAVLRSNRISMLPIVSLIIFILLLLVSRVTHILFDSFNQSIINQLFIKLVRDYSLAISFSVLIITIKNHKTSLVRNIPFHKRMADFSYTIYLLHVPLMVFITAMLAGNFGVRFLVEPNINSLLICCIILISIYLALYGFSQITEKYTPNVKSLINSKVA